MLHGSINHVSVSVSDLDEAMRFFGPLLEFLGYTRGEVLDYDDRRLTVNVNERNGTAVNVWQAKLEHRFEVYEPGLHHVCWNVATHEQVDELSQLLPQIGGEILDGPGEFPYAEHGYYAVYVLGPDRMKFEVVHMPELEPLLSSAR
jgi:catechol 2,3-dioxygenase-like lactoylglutathione lyase family enzyme